MLKKTEKLDRSAIRSLSVFLYVRLSQRDCGVFISYQLFAKSGG